MPLIIIGLIFLIGLLILQIAKFIQEKRSDNTPVRERYKDKFEDKENDIN